MSVRVSSRIWEHATQAGGALIVLLAMADFADDDGICFPSIAKLAKKARLSERQTTTIIQRLEADGAIFYAPGNGRGNMGTFMVVAGLTRNELTRITQERQKDEVFSPFLERVKSLQKGEVCDTKRVKSVQQKGEVCDTKRVKSVQTDETPSDASGRQETPISPVMNRHEIRHEIRHGDPPPPPTPFTQQTPQPPDGGGDGETERLQQPPNQPNQQSLELLKRAGIISSAARQRAAVLSPDAVREIIRLAEQRPRHQRPGWIVRECDARLAAPEPAPITQEDSDGPDENRPRREPIPRALTPWELDQLLGA